MKSGEDKESMRIKWLGMVLVGSGMVFNSLVLFFSFSGSTNEIQYDVPANQTSIYGHGTLSDSIST